MDELELRPGGPPQAAPPTIAQLKTELRYERRRARDRRFTAAVLAVLAALAVLAVLAGFVWLPVLRIHGRAMEPTLAEGDLVVTLRGKDPKPGSLVYFYIGNELLVRRCIAGPGQWVDIDQDGNVYVDNILLEEPYLTEKALDSCDIELPCRVPEGCFFRSASSRSAPCARARCGQRSTAARVCLPCPRACSGNCWTTQRPAASKTARSSSAAAAAPSRATALRWSCSRAQAGCRAGRT